MRFSRRIEGLKLSPTVAVMQEAQALREAGVKIIDFGPGEPDFATPVPAARAAIEAIRSDFTKYTPVAGISPLREALAHRLSLRTGRRLEASNLIVTTGGKQAIYNLCAALFEEGVEVLVPRPYWVTFPEAVRLSGAEPRYLDTREEQGFLPDMISLAQALSGRVKGLIVNYPNNPTGAVLDEKHFRGIGAMVREKGVFLISDETYDSFDYRDAALGGASFLNYWEGDLEGIAMVGSFSKTFSMTGWRIGYAVGSAELIAGLTALQSHQTGNPSSISQKAALAVLDEDPGAVKARREEYRGRRDLIAEGLNQLPGVECPIPQGAFYVFPNVKGLIESKGCPGSVELARMMLREAGVAVVPGAAFGTEGHLRFSYALPADLIREGIERLKKFCGATTRP